MADIHPKILLVEGKQDVRVIPELIEANGVNWETKKRPVELQASGLSALGIMIDADDNPLGRWQSIRGASLKSIPDLPETLPEEGLIHTAPNGIKFGIWLMPDNRVCGMLETFLTYMIPTGNEVLWQFAQEVAQAAKDKGAAFTDSHLDKANIYTWLAWQHPPGRQLHQGIMERILNPKHPNAQRFVTWFRTLYDLS